MNESVQRPQSEQPLSWSQLSGQYRIIGSELLRYESNNVAYTDRSEQLFNEFRTGVSFVGLEVLESYLEDLLDLEVSEQKLFIHREKSGRGSFLGAAAGVLCAFAFGLYAASLGASLILSFAFTVCLALPFAVLLHFHPREGLARRMGFAQIVSHEVSRRRGTYTDDKGRRFDGLHLGELLQSKIARSAQGTAFSWRH